MPETIPRKGIFHGWFVLAAGFLTLFLSVGPRNGFGVFVIPMSNELNWDRGTISLALAIGWLVNGVSQPFIRRLYDRYRGRKIISVSLFVLGLARFSSARPTAYCSWSSSSAL